jgi:transcriptional regulator with XRE-family HTH domain
VNSTFVDRLAKLPFTNSEELIFKIGAKIQELRELKGVNNYEKFAIANDMSRPHYWNIEKGKVNLTIKTLSKILNALAVKIEDFLKALSED